MSASGWASHDRATQPERMASFAMGSPMAMTLNDPPSADDLAGVESAKLRYPDVFA